MWNIVALSRVNFFFKLSPDCPTCGQFLQLVERVFLLNQELERLRTRVEILENEGVTSPPDCVTTPTQTVGTGDDCTVTVGDVTRTFPDGMFVTLQDKSICYCTVSILHCRSYVLEKYTTLRASEPSPVFGEVETNRDYNHNNSKGY